MWDNNFEEPEDANLADVPQEPDFLDEELDLQDLEMEDDNE